MSHPPLLSNGLPLPDTADYVGALCATAPGALADGSAATQLAARGYVLLRGLLPRALVLAMRERYFSLFPPGFVADGDCRRGAYAGQCAPLPAHGTAGHPAHRYVRMPEFRAFAAHEIFRRTAEALLGGAATRLERTPVRHFVPGRSASSRAHIDGTYVDAAPEDLLTFWVPLGDCPRSTGGLVYLEDSHREPDIAARTQDIAPCDRLSDRRPLTHDLRWMADFTGRRWLMADYAAGDVVVHTPHIVHASLDCQSEQMRLSTDIRYLRAGSHYDPRWRADWSADDGY